MEHILWWLWLISIHMEHSASESRRVQWRMSVARLPTLNSLIRLWRRRNLTPPHSSKVNGRAGTCLPIRFNELCKRSTHSFTSCDCLAAKCAESTRTWHSRLSEIPLKKKKKKIKAFERRAIDFEVNENPAAWNFTVENDWVTQCRHVGDVFQKRKDGKKKHLRFVDGALRYSWEIKQRRGESAGGGRVGLLLTSNGKHIKRGGGGERFEPTHHSLCRSRRAAWNPLPLRYFSLSTGTLRESQLYCSAQSTERSYSSFCDWLQGCKPQLRRRLIKQWFLIFLKQVKSSLIFQYCYSSFRQWAGKVDTKCNNWN